MKIKVRYIVIIVILFVYLLVMYLLVGKDNVRQEKLTTKLIVENSSVWELADKRWLNIEDEDSLKKLDWTLFNVYEDDKNIGKYYVWYDDQWYLFDKNREAVNIEGKLFAYQANYKIPIKKYTSKHLDDFTDVEGILNEKSIDINEEFTISEFIKIDIDNDGSDEVIYLFSNAFPEESDPEEIFSLVFMVKDDVTYLMYDKREENIGFSGCKPYVNQIVDIDDDNKYEIILSCGRYSAQKPIDMLLKFTGDKFSVLIDNQ